MSIGDEGEGVVCLDEQRVARITIHTAVGAGDDVRGASSERGLKQRQRHPHPRHTWLENMRLARETMCGRSAS